MPGHALVSPELLNILRCPEDHSSLHLADAVLTARLNEQIATGELKNIAGAVIESPLDGGLVREDGKRLYPIVQGLPRMLVDEGVLLSDEDRDHSASDDNREGAAPPDDA